jgi:CubicO group peptidase (beta-lactamase class C family)
VKLFGSRGPAYKPGSRFEYSNYGFIMLGVVVERVTGESYHDYVRTHVYAPAGMNDTGSEPEDVTVPNRSIGYTTDKGKIVPNTDTLPYRGTSAGGGYSTVGDLLKFANALQAHVLLDAQHTDMLTTGKVRMPTLPDVDRKYAFGFGDQIENGIRCFGHDGGAPGLNGSLDICPATGYTVIALANVDPPAASDVVDFIINNMALP